MPTLYVPGKPNPYFPKHKFYSVPVYGSYQRIEECKLHHYVGPAATVEKGIAAYALSPEHLWATFQNGPQRSQIEASIRAIAAGGGVA